jgi:hypothetical protein
MLDLRIQQHFIDSADLHYQVAETLAKPLRPVSRLINDDLPTLLLPIKAYSGLSGLGHEAVSGLLMIYVAL